MPTYEVQAPDGRKVRLTGDKPPTERDLERIFAQLPSGEEFSTLESMARGAASGVTLGFYDEIVGAIESAFTDKSYVQARDEARANQAAARKEDPWTFGLSEFAGGFALPGGTAGKVLTKSAGLGARAARGAAIGASYGGAAGAGYSEGKTVGEVARDTATGAAIGGTFGAAVPTATRGYQRLKQATNPRNRAAKAISDLIDAEGLDRGELAGMLKRNPDATLGDLLGPEAQDHMAQYIVKDPELWAKFNNRNRGLARAMQEIIGPLDKLATPPAEIGKQFDQYYKLFDGSGIKGNPNAEQYLNRLIGYWDDATQQLVPGKYTEKLQAAQSTIFDQMRKNKILSNKVGKVDTRTMNQTVHDLLQDLRVVSKTGRTGAVDASGAAQKVSRRLVSKLRSDIKRDWKKVNPKMIDNMSTYRKAITKREAVEKAYERISKRLNKPKDFFDELEQGQLGLQFDKDINLLLPDPKMRETVNETVRVLQRMAQTQKRMRIRKDQPASIEREASERLQALRTDLGNFLQVMSPLQSAGPGQHGLAIGAAWRKLARSLTDLVPFNIPGTGAKRVEAEFQDALRGRLLPLIDKTGARRGLTSREAMLAGALAAEGAD